jgi:TPR repeat protein
VASGNVLAHVLLGDLLLTGNGVDADPARGIALYEAVADDQPMAQYALGLAYANGTGVPIDRNLAIDWLRKSELYGVSEATEQLAALTASPDPNAIDLTGFGREGPGY